MKRLTTLFTLILLFLLAGIVSAQDQDGVIEEADYWLRLSRSDDALRTLTPADAARELQNIWKDVKTVRLSDGEVMTIDTTWLQPDPNSFNAEMADTMQARIRGLIEFQAQRSGLSPEEMLARLEELMKDFQYSQRQPSRSTNTTTVNNPNTGIGLPGELFQMVLMVIGIIVALAVVFYFTRNLRLQAIALDGDKNHDDIPATSADADNLADASVASRNYRAAIRYLYLSSLLLLDERGVINFDPNLTNLEHLKQVRNRPRLNELLTSIVDVFDHVWYGFAPVDETMFRRFRENVDQLKQIQQP